jgi:WD40 repeat protein/serine/threonine protein kinase
VDGALLCWKDEGAVNDLDEKAMPVFLEAIEQQSPEESALFLTAACGGDQALRDRVEELLQAHRRASSFLGGPSNPNEDTADTVADTIGSRIGPYKLLEQIGEGGFGVVFLAEQQTPVRRKVALKILKPGMDSRSVIARFEAERQALALMDHPNIARVLDAGQTTLGRPYFVMELVKGIPITEFCDEQQLTPRERLELFLPVCEAVQHAHQKAIIHRDLKPTNVLIATYDGRPVPKIIDFGVAKALGQRLTERTLETGFGGIVGTLEYMSPEQAEFNALDVDTRSDIYSLGVLLYELFTGTTPLTKKRLEQAGVSEVLRLIREEDPPKPSTRVSHSKESLVSISAERKLEPARLARQLRGDLDWIVMMCLEKDRIRRYETASSLARDIRRYLTDEPVEACPPSTAYRLRKFARKNRSMLVTAGAFVLLLAAAALASTWQAIRATLAERKARKAESAAVEEKTVALSVADRNRRLLYSADVQVASQAWQSPEGTFSQCKELLLAHIPGPGQPDLREFCWRYQWRLLNRGSVVRLPVVPRAASVTADGRVVALDESGKVIAWRIGDKKVSEGSTLAGGAVKGVTLSRNGEVAAVIDRDGLPKLFDVRTTIQKVQIRAPSALINLKLSANGRFLAGIGRDKHARVWDTANGKELHDYLMIDPTAREIDLSLDGKQLLASWGQAQDTLVVLYQEGKEKPLVLNPQNLGYIMLQGTLSPEGKLAAVACAANAILVYDTTTGKRQPRFRGLDGEWRDFLPSQSAPLRVAFSPGGNQLAVGEVTGLVTLWNIPRPAPSPLPLRGRGKGEGAAGGRPIPRHLKGHQNRIEVLAFSADGRKLISISRDNTARCWDVADQEEARVLQRGRTFDGLSYSPDGRYLVEASMEPQKDAGVRVHDLSSTGPPRLLTSRPSRRAEFSPDGRTIAGGPDHRVTLWDAQSGDLLATLSESDPAEQDPVNGFSNLGALAFSPDGRWLAAGFGGVFNFSVDAPQKVMVFDVAQRKVHRTFATPTQVSAVAFSADGKLLAAAGHNGTVWLWDTATWNEIGRWQGPAGTGYNSILFLSSGQAGQAGRPADILAAGSRSGRIDLWDVRTQALAWQLQGHIALISFMALSPDGRTLASASCDRSIKLWDTGTGRELRTLGREEGWMCALAFSPDGNSLASGGLNGLLRLWEASSKETVAADLAELDSKTSTSRPQ